jgi:hypothetical protein
MVLFLGSGGGGNSGQVLGAGSLDLGALDWDDGSIGVGNETSITKSVGGGIAVASCVTVSSSVTGKTSSSEMLGTGSLDCGLIDGDNGSIGVGNKGSGVSKRVVKVVVGKWVTGIGGIWVTSIASVLESVSGKVSSLGSLDLKGLSGGNGTVGVFNELGAGNSHASKENLE